MDVSGREEYAEQGRLPLARAMKLKVKSRVFSGVVVRHPQGGAWGVLLVDSLTEGLIIKEKEKDLELYAKLLGKLI
jgi:hypothetical protein